MKKEGGGRLRLFMVSHPIFWLYHLVIHSSGLMLRDVDSGLSRLGNDRPTVSVMHDKKTQNSGQGMR